MEASRQLVSWKNDSGVTADWLSYCSMYSVIFKFIQWTHSEKDPFKYCNTVTDIICACACMALLNKHHKKRTYECQSSAL